MEVCSETFRGIIDCGKDYRRGHDCHGQRERNSEQADHFLSLPDRPGALIALGKLAFVVGKVVRPIGNPEGAKDKGQDQRESARHDAADEQPVDHAAASLSLRSSGAGKSVVLRDLPCAAASLSISG